MEFSEVEDVQRHVESLLPDEGIRRTCLSIFADSVVRLHSCGADSWGVYCTNKRVRLLAGSLIVLTLEHQCVWLTLDRVLLAASSKLQQDLEAIEAWSWDTTDYPEYSKVPSKNGCYVPSVTHDADWPTLRALHLSFLEQVVQKFERLDPRSQKKYQPSLIKYLRQVLGRDLPEPCYDNVAERRKSPTLRLLPEELPPGQKLHEGSRVQIVVNSYERNPAARQRCIDYYGERCVVCGFDFAEKYGAFAAGYIHVHHLTPLADIGETYEVDPFADLRPVCPNCHAVIHKRNPPLTIDEVQSLIATAETHRTTVGTSK